VQFTISDFEESLNPPNGGLVVVERRSDGEVRHAGAGLLVVRPDLSCVRTASVVPKT
jgi:hypothetical protein